LHYSGEFDLAKIPIIRATTRARADVSRAAYRIRFMRTRLASADAAEEIACTGVAGR
jgi:hypothetical protein